MEEAVMKQYSITLTFTEKEFIAKGTNNFVVLQILAAWLYLRMMILQPCESETQEITVEGVIFPSRLCTRCMDRRQCGYETILNMKTEVSFLSCKCVNKNGLNK